MSEPGSTRSEAPDTAHPVPGVTEWVGAPVIAVDVAVRSRECERDGRSGVRGDDAVVQGSVHSAVIPPLTWREREVIVCAGRGLTYSEIASELAISVNTVRFHLKSVYGKLGVRSKRAAACRLGHVPSESSVRDLIRSAPRAADLTARQQDVLGLVLTGMTMPEIGEQLFLSTPTVKSHAIAAYKKLGVHSRHDALVAVDPLCCTAEAS